MKQQRQWQQQGELLWQRQQRQWKGQRQGQRSGICNFQGYPSKNRFAGFELHNTWSLFALDECSEGKQVLHNTQGPTFKSRWNSVKCKTASLVISDPIGYLLISGVRNFSSSAHQRSLTVFNGSDFTGMALFLSIEPVGLKNGIKPHYYSYHSNSANSNFFQLPLLGFLYKEQEFYSTGPRGQPICVWIFDGPGSFPLFEQIVKLTKWTKSKLCEKIFRLELRTVRPRADLLLWPISWMEKRERESVCSNECVRVLECVCACACACVCECVWERERERKRKRKNWIELKAWTGEWKLAKNSARLNTNHDSGRKKNRNSENFFSSVLFFQRNYWGMFEPERPSRNGTGSCFLSEWAGFRPRRIPKISKHQDALQ